MTATETTELDRLYAPFLAVARDPARLAALAVLSAAKVNLAGADMDAAAEAMRRELDVAAELGRASS
jgi:hypothetical protein